MPKNNNLKAKSFPMPILFNEEPHTYFKNALESINVTLINPPGWEDLKQYCIPFANGTWADNPLEILSNINNCKNCYCDDLIMHHIFSNKILPTTMETIRLNFLIEGISLQEVTHILRYRKAVFSAECSGDKWLTNKDCLVPTAIENSNIDSDNDFYTRYKDIVRAAKVLYCDMIDSKCITIHDARSILPRAIETHYFMSMSLKDALGFIWDRVDKQIQPITDNVIAYRMIKALIDVYPILVKTINKKYIHQPSKFYVNTARQFRSTNWFKPDEDSDVFEWNENDFVYKNKLRDDINGTNENLATKRNIFKNIKKEIDVYLENREHFIDAAYGKDFFSQDIPEELFGGK